MLLQQFQEHFKQNFSHLSSLNCQLILAVSGGIDSVVMTDLFYRSGFDFAIVHCNFLLREEESERDESFVRSLQIKYNKEVLVRTFDTKQYALEHKISIQEAARELRYEWFKELQIQNSKVKSQNYVATAHNADDNIETALMFFLRGTGIHGLTGINQFDKERKIIRPLLFATRKEIEIYAEENNITWVEDSSNATDKYTRNFLRHNILPSIEKQFPKAKENILENIHRFKEVEILYRRSIELHKKKLLEYKGNEVHIPVLKLQKIQPPDTILWEIIKDYNFHPHQINEVKKLFDAGNSCYIQSSTHRILRNRNWLIFVANNNEAAKHALIEKEDTDVRFQNGVLNFEMLHANSAQLTAHNFVAQLDAMHIQFPLLLRKWKQGDYFYPLGMSKKKKLSRFFIDQKLSPTEKENAWVIEMDKKIVWIVGYRIDDRFKIKPSTKEVLKISFTAAEIR